MLRSARLSGLVVAGVLGLLLPSCNSSNNTTGGSNLPRTPVRTVVGSRTFSVGVRDAVFVDIQITGTGTMDAIVNWTFTSNDVDVVFTNTSCTTTDQLLRGGCTEMASATSSTAKPERLNMSVTTGTYRIIVFNWGPGGESGTVEVGLTS
jgi:hypothetical protein